MPLSWEERASTITLIRNKSNMVQTSFPAEGKITADGRYCIISQIYYSLPDLLCEKRFCLFVCLCVSKNDTEPHQSAVSENCLGTGEKGKATTGTLE